MNETTNVDSNAEVANPVEPIVSLLITNDTELTQKANMFGDGEDGYFMQEYSLFADDKKTGVTMLVTGNMGKDNTERKFTVNGKDYDIAKDAFIAAGHVWSRAS